MTVMWTPPPDVFETLVVAESPQEEAERRAVVHETLSVSVDEEVDFDQVLSMFDPPTRRGVTASTIGFSDGLAGRGTDVNQAIGAFVRSDVRADGVD